MGCVLSLSKDIPNASVLVITSETQSTPIAFLFDGIVSLGGFSYYVLQGAKDERIHEENGLKGVS